MSPIQKLFATAALLASVGVSSAARGDADDDDDASASDSAAESSSAAKAKEDYARAAAFRRAALESAIRKLNEMLPREAGPPVPAIQLQIVKQWLKVEPRDKRFPEVVGKARRQLLASLAATSRVKVVLPPDSFGLCRLIDSEQEDPYAFHVKKEHQILLCRSWQGMSAGCQRIAVLHEYLHEVGADDVANPRTPDEALADADTLALLASQLHRNATDSDRCPGDSALKLPSVDQLSPPP
jgi:hypothetical protein